MTTWTLLADQTPPYTGSYIVCTDTYRVCTAKWWEQTKRFSGPIGKHVIAWMMLPDPPEER